MTEKSLEENKEKVTTKEVSKEVKEIKDVKESKEAKEVKEPKETKEVKDASASKTQQRPFTRNGNGYQQQQVRTPNGAKVMDARELGKLSVAELTKLAVNLNIEETSGLKKQALIGKIIAVQAKQNGSIYGGGVLEILPDGFGFLRSEDNNYLAGPEDIYVSPSQIKRFGLRKGDTIEGLIRPPKDGERFFAMLQVQKVNDIEVEKIYNRPLFDNLTPLHPNKRFTLELDKNDITQRIIDLMAPIGRGQRALIVAPPKTGKTMMMQSIANSITNNYKEVKLIVLLIDERPEEVTDMSRSVKGEVIASTFDEAPDRHVQVAEMALERAKRLVEQGTDVVILLDSITRLARAYNTVTPSSGRVLTGGLEATSLQRPKRFLGAARNMEEGGSLTIIATALVETGSRMDEVIFEEFKGTGNSEICLDRKLSDRRLFPAIDLNRSSTRKEDLLLSEDELNKVWIIRKVLAPLTSVDAMTLLRDKIVASKSNKDFLKQMEVSSL
ncbi:Transcription termination factor [Elusimicrobium minutum Pei191]|uniref:Transcription termination factor Rho n=1 Tax=Elusimicrobium minutum (strain Pei191) TaxID=445932 RepID=B2KCD4_ELUMP|nr:Transcription termination factor [Elusimicrobium minutum Pei191]